MTNARRASADALSRRNLLALGGAAAVAGLVAAPVTRAADDTIAARPLPHSTDKLPVVGLGTALSIAPAQRAAYVAVLKRLVAGGGKLIDTASTYGDMEVVLGDLLTEANLRDQVFLATKIEATEPKAGTIEFHRSLNRLRRQSVDLLQLHNVADPKQSLAMFRDFKKQGLCGFIGVTSTFPGDYAAMETVVRREKPDFMQIAYSLGDREAETRLIPAAAAVGAGVLTALPLGRSSLFRKVHGKPLPDWAKEFDAATWGQFFLKYVLGNPHVTAVIPGTDKPEHMADNLAAGRGRFPDTGERKKMVQFFESL